MFELVDDHAGISLTRHALAARREPLGFAASERFYEIGTPEALAEASAFLARGLLRVGPGTPQRLIIA